MVETAKLGLANLSPNRQDSLVCREAKELWREIPRRAIHGPMVARFLEAIGLFSKEVTYQPNAPYSPGVNGVAILMQDRERLLDRGYLAKNRRHALLAETLASALAHNLLEAELDYKCKGERWMLLYLNRLLCAHFQLPLNYGGFREKRLDDLSRWVDGGYTPVRSTKQLI